MATSRDGAYRQRMSPSTRPFGALLRDWRQRRRVSQLALACEAQISSKHLSFLETGRSQPSREMILRLAEELEIPLRERNALLASAGFAAGYAVHAFDDGALDRARSAVLAVLTGHLPHPALAVDRHWTLLMANAAVAPLLDGVDPSLLQPSANVLRLSLHPGGLAPRIKNLRVWRDHLLARLRRQIEATADTKLIALSAELAAYPVMDTNTEPRPLGHSLDVAVPLELATKQGVLRLLSTTTVFGTPVEVTLSELAIEAFFPADAETARTLVSLGARNLRQSRSPFGRSSSFAVALERVALERSLERNVDEQSRDFARGARSVRVSIHLRTDRRAVVEERELLREALGVFDARLVPDVPK
jgi:transcriptional regulator with XRE-family HTH domain